MEWLALLLHPPEQRQPDVRLLLPGAEGQLPEAVCCSLADHLTWVDPWITAAPACTCHGQPVLMLLPVDTGVAAGGAGAGVPPAGAGAQARHRAARDVALALNMQRCRSRQA